jgi:hypothetical protein
MLKYESSIVKRKLIPMEPRLFCLSVGNSPVDYSDMLHFKEIFNFTQSSLDPSGVFLLDFFSDAFIWIGNKIHERNLVLQLAHQALIMMRP